MFGIFNSGRLEVFSPMVRYFFLISYIGTRYRGSQRYTEFPNETVQGVIEAAFSSVETVNAPRTSFASRTDKGVHALMNSFHVDLEHKRQGEVYQPNFLKKVLNSYLKENNHEILITRASVVPDSFHARFHVRWRSYLYRLAVAKPELRVTFPETKSCEQFLPISLVNRCHIVPSNLNIKSVKEVLGLYRGCHDFSAFTKYTLRDPWRVTKRVIDEIEFYELPHHTCFDDNDNVILWEFHVKSAAFLYHQVRKLIGTALAAGFGQISASDVENLLKYPTPDKYAKVHLAPACGLYLANIHYGNEGFSGKDPVNSHKESLEVT